MTEAALILFCTIAGASIGYHFGWMRGATEYSNKLIRCIRGEDWRG
jgi:hypothetical protein